jgi:hypothetical protein
MKPSRTEAAIWRGWTRAGILALLVVAVMAMAVGSPAATLYVSQTSGNPSLPYATLGSAANDIQQAVEAASDGDTVLVAPGTYGLSSQVTLTKAIVLRSTMGADQTVLNALDNIWCLWISNALAVADGFTILPVTGGFTTLNVGGAFLAGGTIQNCRITKDYITTAVSMIGGVLSNSIVIYARGPIDAPAVYCTSGGLITDCQVLALGRRLGPSGTGIYLVESQLRDSVILGSEGNFQQADGSAVFALSSTITGCTITHNFSDSSGAGAYLGSCLMDRCIVANNYAATYGLPGTGGGGIFATNSIILNSLIVSNKVGAGAAEISPGYGGGVYLRGGALVNCTVSENWAAYCGSGKGAGIYVESGGITNSIIYSNYFDSGCTDANIEWFNEGAGVFDHCCTAPDPGGVGNIVQRPQFVSLSTGDYRLAITSPCIAAGTVQAWMVGAHDLEGNARTMDGTVDLGAYQNQLAKMTPPTAMCSATPTSGHAPLTVQFADESIGSVTNWDWKFGDGSETSSARNPSHTYTKPGNYTATLSVGGNGGSKRTSMRIHVTGPTPRRQDRNLAR